MRFAANSRATTQPLLRDASRAFGDLLPAEACARCVEKKRSTHVALCRNAIALCQAGRLSASTHAVLTVYARAKHMSAALHTSYRCVRKKGLLQMSDARHMAPYPPSSALRHRAGASAPTVRKNPFSVHAVRMSLANIDCGGARGLRSKVLCGR